ncbi:MAG: hypothetical protein M3R24_14285 [Chloroflexota bacterium]|nr:hypothetical protein [Chloroflexota bacterium]PLS83814.1 MAG: hypothetical protein CYG59_00090 [Chloroflexota bacterium]
MNVVILTDDELEFIKLRVGDALPRQDLMLSTPPSVLDVRASGRCVRCLIDVRSNSLFGYVCCPQCGQPVTSSY